ncbi:hypothetical protein HYU19_02200 [Candidatus Woesearchaeota archaeon]|nr:hypothetical protein [Candidatus Woesearchaeota archaeon]
MRIDQLAAAVEERINTNLAALSRNTLAVYVRRFDPAVYSASGDGQTKNPVYEALRRSVCSPARVYLLDQGLQLSSPLPGDHALSEEKQGVDGLVCRRFVVDVSRKRGEEETGEPIGSLALVFPHRHDYLLMLNASVQGYEPRKVPVVWNYEMPSSDVETATE